MISRYQLGFALFGAFIISLTTQPLSAGEICRRICIDGYWDFCARAHPYQEKTTHEIDHVVLYIERAKDGTFSFASNVLSQGSSFPTKIVGFKEVVDLDNAFFNLDPTFQSQVEANSDKVLETFHDTAEVYVTADVVDPRLSPQLDTKGMKNIHVLKSAQ